MELYDQGSDIGLMCFKLKVVHKRKSLIINYRLLTKIELFKGEDQAARGPQLCFCKNIFFDMEFELVRVGQRDGDGHHAELLEGSASPSALA